MVKSVFRISETQFTIKDYYVQGGTQIVDDEIWGHNG